MAADDPVVLTESAYELLKEIVADYLSGLEGATNRPAHVERKGRRPEVYLARVRKPGITAFSLGALTGTGTGSDISDDVFGSGVCDVYRRLDDGRIIAVAKTVTVYNLSFVAVAEWQWILVIQDKSGTWWTLPPAPVVPAIDCTNEERVTSVCFDKVTQDLTVEYTTLNRCTGELVSQRCEVNPSDCCPIQVICCNKVYLLPRKICAHVTDATGSYAYLSGQYVQFTYFESANPFFASGWVSDESIFHDLVANSFCLRATCGDLANGFEWEISRCQGTGLDPFFGFTNVSCGRADLGCPDPADVLPAMMNVPYGNSPNQITFYLTEGECPQTTGTGTGTGGSTGTPCCPAGLSSILLLTLNEDCLAGTYPITFDPTTTQWNYFGPPSAVCAGGQLSASLQCFGGNWVVSATCVRGTAVQTWQWTLPPTCTLPLTLTPITGVTSGGGSPCLSGLASLSGSVHT